MKIIGLCGGSGAGKGYVCSLFAAHGIPSIDADAVYHRLTSFYSACMEELSEAFGDEIVNEDGSLNRAVLADRVFADGNEDDLAQLDAITHKHVLEAIRDEMENYRDRPAVILDAPLLYESNMDDWCDFVVAVLADEDVRVKRIVARDGITEERARARMRAGCEDAYLRAHADYLIENNGDEDALNRSVQAIVDVILR